MPNRNFAMFFTLVAFMMLPFTSYAKIFRNAYISFEMPDSWNCKLEQTEWVCRADQSKESKEAVIILTAKEVGPTDSFQLYDLHLKSPIPAPSKSGEGVLSKVVYPPKTVNINDQPWIDGLHAGSEVKNYYTRYLATVKEKIAILVTFSAHQTLYAKYAQEFFKTINSLRVIATKDLLARPDLGPLRPGAETLGAGVSAAMPGDLATMDSDQDQPKKNSQNEFYIAAGILVAAIGFYVFMKMRKS